MVGVEEPGGVPRTLHLAPFIPQDRFISAGAVHIAAQQAKSLITVADTWTEHPPHPSQLLRNCAVLAQIIPYHLEKILAEDFERWFTLFKKSSTKIISVSLATHQI
jgi:hypothetical protein